jgi:hypothetical protein
MGFVEKAKLNVVKRHWIQIGEERERERIIHLLEEMYKDKSGINLKGALALLRGKYGNLK